MQCFENSFDGGLIRCCGQLHELEELIAEALSDAEKESDSDEEDEEKDLDFLIVQHKVLKLDLNLI